MARALKNFVLTLPCLREDGRELASGKTLVNHPFSFGSLKFYQAEYGIAEADLLLGINDEELLVKKIGDEFTVDGARI